MGILLFVDQSCAITMSLTRTQNDPAKQGEDIFYIFLERENPKKIKEFLSKHLFSELEKSSFNPFQ